MAEEACYVREQASQRTGQGPSLPYFLEDSSTIADSMSWTDSVSESNNIDWWQRHDTL